MYFVIDFSQILFKHYTHLYNINRLRKLKDITNKLGYHKIMKTMVIDLPGLMDNKFRLQSI